MDAENTAETNTTRATAKEAYFDRNLNLTTPESATRTINYFEQQISEVTSDLTKMIRDMEKDRDIVIQGIFSPDKSTVIWGREPHNLLTKAANPGAKIIGSKFEIKNWESPRNKGTYYLGCYVFGETEEEASQLATMLQKHVQPDQYMRLDARTIGDTENLGREIYRGNIHHFF